MLCSSMSIWIFSGLIRLVGGAPTGISRLTECSCIGMVMISITSKTSITSIRGVVLISIMTSGSPELLVFPTCIPMGQFPCWRSTAQRRGLGDKGDFDDARALAGQQDFADAFVAGIGVTAHLDFGLGLDGGDFLEFLHQSVNILDARFVPEDVAGLIDRDDDVLGLGFANFNALFG